MPTSTRADGTARKSYVRIVTDKRREQNRRAQKVYRERLKKKFEALEEQAALAHPEPAATLENAGDISHPVPTAEIEVDHWVNADHTDPLAQSPPGTPRRQGRVINFTDVFAAAGDISIGNAAVIPGFHLQVAETPAPSVDVEEDELCEHIHEDFGDMDLRPIWDTPHPAQYLTPPGSLRGSSSKSLMTLTSQRTSMSSPSSESSLPNPYINVMRLVGESNLEASIAVGLSIKITRSSYINDHPSSFPGCYVALNTPTRSTSRSLSYKFADTFMDVTPSLQKHLDDIRQPLRPTPAQLLNPHPTYLDCIVFPHFRERATKASAEGLLDHASLFHDLVAGGLVCWGGMSGMVNRHGKSGRRGGRDMRDNVAWSSRSWEAKEWFLKKWTWLIGTEDDEEERSDADGIWGGSRWWRSMRGEDDSDEEDERVPVVERVREVVDGSHCV